MLKVMEHDPEFHRFLQENRFNVSERRTVVGPRMDPDYEEWVERQFMTGLHTLRRRWYYGADGTLLSLMPDPIASGSAHLFSDVVMTSAAVVSVCGVSATWSG